MDMEPSGNAIEKSEEKTVENIVEELDKEEGVQSAPVSGSQSVVNQLHNDEKARRRRYQRHIYFRNRNARRRGTARRHLATS